jgi:predicted Zn-dependent peptidase
LWFLLESERFLRPVLREFYKERDAVREERRMRVEPSPQGQLIEALLSTAFAAHPYRNWAGGWPNAISAAFPLALRLPWCARKSPRRSARNA